MNDQTTCEFFHGSQGCVFRYRFLYHTAISSSVLRQITDSVFNSILRTVDGHFVELSVFSHDGDLAALFRIRSEQCSRSLGTSCAHQSGEAQDFSLSQFEAYILHHLARVQMFHFENYRSIRRNHAVLLGILIDHTSNHHVDDVFLSTFRCDQSSYITAVTHNRYTVRNHLDLVHTVGNINNSEIFAAKVFNDFKEIRNLFFCQRC